MSFFSRYNNLPYRKKQTWANNQAKSKADPLFELRNNTEYVKKSFFLDPILNLLDAEVVPQPSSFLNPQGQPQAFYVLGSLPYGCFVIYSLNKVCVCEGTNGDGSPKFLRGTYYSLDGDMFMTGKISGKSFWEAKFVETVQSYVRLYHPGAV